MTSPMTKALPALISPLLSVVTMGLADAEVISATAELVAQVAILIVAVVTLIRTFKKQ